MCKKIRIGGVPEHFNLPIHLAMETGKFDPLKIDLEWKTFDGGTGQMTKALRNDDVDMCVVLSEGIIADIINGNPSKLVSIYINTPLCWGIHTGSNNTLDHYDKIFDKKYAISRKGSGSHLMAIVDANSKGKIIDESQFIIINKLSNAIESLTKLETDVFYWEKFTTKPHVDNGTLNRIGEFYSPWPCFVMAATNRIIDKEPELIDRVCKIILESNASFMNDLDSVLKVEKRYNLGLSDVQKWYHSTEWATNAWISNKMIESIIYNLKLAKIISVNDFIPEIIWTKHK